MGFRYDKLFELAKARGMNKTGLREKTGISTATLAKLSKNETVGMDVLERICACLRCQPGDIMSFEVVTENALLNVLREEMQMNLKGGIYHSTQVKLAYNSNHMEGSRLSEDQTRYIFETNTIGVEEENTAVNVDDIVETNNHFDAFRYLLDVAEEDLSEQIIKEFHRILKNGTSDSRKDWFRIGDYKLKPNMVGDKETSAPEQVEADMQKLLTAYHQIKERTIEDLIAFHYRFESIHPFQDGNGRVGRLILFKECLKYGFVPIMIEDKYKQFYYRGLKEYEREKGYLTDTCLNGQDMYQALMDYFKVEI
ncbi:MAG: Fic family protein [Lachnospiraceae bacterium]|nr:Fic family protein [Lachnospiraceae bacterium]